MIKKIITDSGANILSSTILGQKHINVPLSIIIDNNIWLDDNNINIDNFIQAIINTSKKPAPHVLALLVGYKHLQVQTRFM